MENNLNNQNGDINLYLKNAFSKLGKKQSEIVQDLGISQSYVSALMAGKKTVGKGMANKLANLYGFDKGAILTGKIEIITPPAPEAEEYDEDEEDELLTFLKEERQNYSLSLYNIHKKTGIPQKILKDFQQGDTELTDEYRERLAYFIEESKEYFEGNAIDTPKGKPTGYYYPDVNIAAGLDISTFNNASNRYPVFIPNFGEKDLIFIDVYGDSMYPKYKAGDVIGIAYTDFRYLIFGHPYVVVFDNGDVNIRYVGKGSDDKNITLASENLKYEPREYPLSIIRAFYAVKGCVNKERM